ncbi:MAG: hypothetical protein HOV68_01935 [Streptomycetaceae bacterium]|nr:hypothetical protein [Streptomycetaceae bacterium]
MTEQAMTVLTHLANEGGEGKHENLNALGAGLGAFIALLILLIITLSFNKDR